MTYNKTFGDKLKALRELKKMTQQQLAMKSKLSVTYIAMLERGERQAPSLENLGQICEALGVRASAFLTDEDFAKDWKDEMFMNFVALRKKMNDDDLLAGFLELLQKIPPRHRLEFYDLNQSALLLRSHQLRILQRLLAALLEPEQQIALDSLTSED